MIPCTVERHYTALLVTFADGSDLLLQDSDDQKQFACYCGLLEVPPEGVDDWPEWGDIDPTDIAHCPDYYWELAA